MACVLYVGYTAGSNCPRIVYLFICAIFMCAKLLWQLTASMWVSAEYVEENGLYGLYLLVLNSSFVFCFDWPVNVLLSQLIVPMWSNLFTFLSGVSFYSGVSFLVGGKRGF